jgi:hypothetical protein
LLRSVDGHMSVRFSSMPHRPEMFESTQTY